MHTHVAVLVRQTRPEAEAAVLAHLLLAPFVPRLFEHLTARDVPIGQIKDGVDAPLMSWIGHALWSWRRVNALN